MICFNPDPLVISGFDGTNLTHSSFRKRFQVRYHLSDIFYRNLLTNGKRSVFPKRSVGVSTEAENVHVRHNFDLRSLVIAKCGNGSEEIAGR